MKLKNLRNRQDLFHEEGMINLVLETIDKYSETKNLPNRMSMPLFEGFKQQQIDDVYDKLYTLLATMIKGIIQKRFAYWFGFFYFISVFYMVIVMPQGQGH